MEPELKKLITSCVEDLESDPLHHLKAVRRLEIYRLINLSEQNNKIHAIRGRLGVASISLVLPIWKDLIQVYGKSFSNKDKVVPYRLIKASENLINNEGNIESAKKMCAEWWGAIGYLHSFVIEHNIPVEMSYICSAALNLLHEVLGIELLGKLQGWQQMSNEKLAKYSFACDVAGIVEVLYSDIEKPNSLKRLEFWTWWLTEAIPQAWELASVATGEQQ